MTTTETSYSKLPDTILILDPEFRLSQEYCDLVEEGMDDLPGVFLSRFGKYLLRRIGDSIQPSNEPAYGLIERLLESGDREVEEAVVNEIFEVRDEPPAVLRRFFDSLGSLGQSLYERTCKPLVEE